MRFPLRVRFSRMHGIRKTFLHRLLATSHSLKIVAYTHELGDAIRQTSEICHHRRREFYGPFLAVHVWTMPLVHEPFRSAINPGIQLMLLHHGHDWFDDIGLQNASLQHAQVRPDEQAAVERSDRRGECQRFD